RLPPVVFGVCWWNRRTVDAMCAPFPAPPVHCPTFAGAVAEAVRRGGCVIAWASRVTAADAASCRAAGVPLIRIEDGFLRSVGLGAGLTPAASLVMDFRGIYYDGAVPSDIEWLLQSAELDDARRARGRALRERIVAA